MTGHRFSDEQLAAILSAPQPPEVYLDWIEIMASLPDGEMTIEDDEVS